MHYQFGIYILKDGPFVLVFVHIMHILDIRVRKYTQYILTLVPKCTEL